MPPKLDRCVRAVKPRTGTSRAYAICTASLQRAGVIPRKSKTMAAKRIPKTTTVLVIQGNYGYGWDDESEYDKGDRKNALADLKEYRFSGGQHRLITRRVKNTAKVANPSASCPRQSPKFNAYQGRTVKYRKKSYEIEGCGIGRTAKRSIGKQEEGTYALRALKTGRKKYVAKRVIRDLAYHRGGKAILGMPKRKKAVKNPSKRGKFHGAAKAEFLARMAAGRRRTGR